MMQAYKKLLEMESIATLKLEQDKKALEHINKILYQDKDFIADKLIIYLKKVLDIDYFKYKVLDLDNNIGDILVKKDSQIFKDNIQNKEYLNFNVEDLIDKRIFDNEDEIILIDLNFDEKLINLKYICDSLQYDYLSYSDKIKEVLSLFINYIINKNIYKK